MRVLVTGGAGFVGGHVVSRLLDDGHDVRILDAALPAAWGDSVPTPDPRADFIAGDVRDRAAVGAALDGVDAVNHQAALVGLGVDLADLPDYAGINDMGTAVVLSAMAERQIPRLVLASSIVVYGEGGWSCPRHGLVQPKPRSADALRAGNFGHECPHCGAPLTWQAVDESAPLNPRSAYAASKVSQEHFAAVWQRATGGSAVALRYHNVYGPRMPRDTPYSGVAAIFRSALQRGTPPRVFEDGCQMRDFVHVDDVARANALALAAEPDGFVPLNIASGDPQSIGEMARLLAEAFGGPPPIVTGEFRLGDVRHIVASADRAQSALGFRAAVSFADGIRSFASAPLR